MSKPRGRRLGRIIPALVGLVLVVGGLYLWFGRPVPPPPRTGDASSLRIASANLLFSNDEPTPAARQLASIDADVLVLIEWTGQNADQEVLRAARLVPLAESVVLGTDGMGVWGRPELTAEAAVMPGPVGGPCHIPLATVRIKRDGSALSLLGIHAPPPMLKCKQTNAPTLRAIAAWIRDGRLVQDVGTARKGDPVILLGDFNALPFFEVMESFPEAGLVDAYAAMHRRPGPTWGPWPEIPALGRIDYVFLPPSLDLRGAWTLHLPGSDHRAVAAEVGFQ